jgi:hypothetical protein
MLIQEILLIKWLNLKFAVKMISIGKHNSRVSMMLDKQISYSELLMPALIMDMSILEMEQDLSLLLLPTEFM